jgi:hypothetical protein
MTRKNKTMKGGILGYIPNQPKYIPESVTNNTFNELVEKLTRDQSGLNKLRAEQRFTHFLNILDYKLKQDNIDPKKFNKLYEYFTKIYNKYKDNFSAILSSNHQLLNQIKKKLDNKKKDISNINKFITRYLGNTNMKLNVEDLKSKLLDIIDSAKKETDLSEFNKLKEKYYYLLSMYKQAFSSNNSSFLNNSKQSFDKLEKNKFPNIFQP